MSNAIALVPLVGLSLALFSSVVSFFLFYSASVRKKYAAERDFQHLKRNQENIQQLIQLLADDIDELKHLIERSIEKF